MRLKLRVYNSDFRITKNYSLTTKTIHFNFFLHTFIPLSSYSFLIRATFSIESEPLVYVRQQYVYKVWTREKKRVGRYTSQHETTCTTQNLKILSLNSLTSPSSGLILKSSLNFSTGLIKTSHTHFILPTFFLLKFLLSTPKVLQTLFIPFLFCKT